MKDEERRELERMKQGTWKAGDCVWLLHLVERLQSELAEARESLDECLSLAGAWAGYYSVAEAYGGNGEVHPAASKDHR